MSITPEQLQEAIDRLPTATSLRDIAADLGIDRSTFRHAIRPFVTVLRASGALPDCVCGQPRFHPYGCTASRERTPRGRWSKGPNERQTLIISLLLDGMPIKQIARMFGADRWTIRYAMKHFTEEQREAYAAIRERNRVAYQFKPAMHPDDRRTLNAMLVDGCSYDDIRRQLGISNDTIAQAMHQLPPKQASQRREAAWRRRRAPDGRFQTAPEPADPTLNEWRVAA